MSPPIEVELMEEDESEQRTFFHARNKTGIVGGQTLWSNDVHVNSLWMKLSEPESNNIPSLQNSFVKHVITTLARTYFNFDNFAAYQAAAHTYQLARLKFVACAIA